MFTRTSPTCTYVPLDLLPSIWPVSFWLIDANTPILSTLLANNVNNLKPSIVKAESKLEATIETANDNYLPTSAALVIMNPYEVEALMRFTTSVSHDGVS